jgi:hypothetical protein
MAEPARSFYGFALDPRKPGNFLLSFLTKGYDIQTWVGTQVGIISVDADVKSMQSVTVEPDAFLLQGNSDPAANVTMLCNAFKVCVTNSPDVLKLIMAPQSVYVTKIALQGGANAAAMAARTPYLGGRTPAPSKSSVSVKRMTCWLTVVLRSKFLAA